MRDRGVFSTAIFSDCSVLLRFITQPTARPRSHVGVVIDSCSHLFSSFSNSSFHLILRRLNSIAHTLAAKASHQATSMFWDLVPPDFVAELIH